MAVARRMIHMALNIRGGIDNAKSLCGCINVDGKTLNTEQEVKRFLWEQLAMGRRLLPCGDCDNFDFETGCKGHDMEE